MDNRLRDKVAVITGGNSGIGLATAREFKSHRAKIVIFGRNRQTLDEAVALIGADTLAVQGGLRKLADLDRLFDEAPTPTSSQRANGVEPTGERKCQYIRSPIIE